MSNNETQNAYNNPPNPGPSQPSQNIGLALASLITGVIALLFCRVFTPITMLCSIPGIVLGSISLGTKKGGKGMAIAGIACGGISLLFLLIYFSMLFR